ncbi:MAG: GGDEF domain-containing protein [Proteobacteria bacterium]|nr:GGDEF domain-containing protein [Pseudomonadota bacterium]
MKQTQQRDTEQYVLLTLSATSVVVLLPYTVYRFVQQEWIVAVVDLTIVIGMAILFLYVYFKRKVRPAAIVLSVLTLAGNLLSVYVKGPEQIYWVFPTIVLIYYLLPPVLAMIFGLVDLVVIYYLVDGLLEPAESTTILATIITTNIFSYVFSHFMKSQTRKLNIIAHRDTLTGTGNRRAMAKEVEHVVNLKKNNNTPVSSILLDYDHFKRINDIYGHAIGDRVLIHTSNLIETIIEGKGKLYRMGGEEFLVILHAMKIEEASKITEKICTEVASRKMEIEHQLTVSLAVSEYKSSETSDSWLSRLDKALYEAKNNGRNQFRVV